MNLNITRAFLFAWCHNYHWISSNYLVMCILMQSLGVLYGISKTRQFNLFQHYLSTEKFWKICGLIVFPLKTLKTGQCVQRQVCCTQECNVIRLSSILLTAHQYCDFQQTNNHGATFTEIFWLPIMFTTLRVHCWTLKATGNSRLWRKHS